MGHIFVWSVEDMFGSPNEQLADLLRDILDNEYERFWGAFKNAIADLVEEGYLR